MPTSLPAALVFHKNQRRGMREEDRLVSSPPRMHAWRAGNQGVKRLASRQALNTENPGPPGDLGEQVGVPHLLGTAGWPPT